MKDWMERAIKTFVQAFFGVLIPALCAMLQNGWPESWGKAWVILAPVIAAALAAAIAAVWNIILEEIRNAPDESDFLGWVDGAIDPDEAEEPGDAAEHSFSRWAEPEHDQNQTATAGTIAEAEAAEEYTGKHEGGQKDE